MGLKSGSTEDWVLSAIIMNKETNMMAVRVMNGMWDELIARFIEDVLKK